MKTTPGEECFCPTGIKGDRNRPGALNTKYTYTPFSVQEHTEISLRSFATNTNIALSISTSKQPKWVCLKLPVSEIQAAFQVIVSAINLNKLM